MENFNFGNQHDNVLKAMEKKRVELEKIRDEKAHMPEELLTLLKDHRMKVHQLAIMDQKLKNYRSNQERKGTSTHPRYMKLSVQRERLDKEITEIYNEIHEDWNFEERQAAYREAEYEYDQHVKRTTFRKNDPDGHFSAN